MPNLLAPAPSPPLAVSTTQTAADTAAVEPAPSYLNNKLKSCGNKGVLACLSAVMDREFELDTLNKAAASVSGAALDVGATIPDPSTSVAQDRLAATAQEAGLASTSRLEQDAEPSQSDVAASGTGVAQHQAPQPVASHSVVLGAAPAVAVADQGPDEYLASLGVEPERGHIGGVSKPNTVLLIKALRKLVDIVAERSDSEASATVQAAKASLSDTRDKVMSSNHPHSHHAALLVELLRREVLLLSCAGSGRLRVMDRTDVDDVTCDGDGATDSLPEPMFVPPPQDATDVDESTVWIMIVSSSTRSVSYRICDVPHVWNISHNVRQMIRKLKAAEDPEILIFAYDGGSGSAFKSRHKVAELHKKHPSSQSSPWIAIDVSLEPSAGKPSALMMLHAPAIDYALDPALVGTDAPSPPGAAAATHDSESVESESVLSVESIDATGSPESGASETEDGGAHASTPTQPAEPASSAPGTPTSQPSKRGSSSKRAGNVKKARAASRRDSVKPPPSATASPEIIAGLRILEASCQYTRKLAAEGVRGCDKFLDGEHDSHKKDLMKIVARQLVICVLSHIAMQLSQSKTFYNREELIKQWLFALVTSIFPFVPEDLILTDRCLPGIYPDRVIESISPEFPEKIPIEVKRGLTDYLGVEFCNDICDLSKSHRPRTRNANQITNYMLRNKCRFGFLTTGNATRIFEIAITKTGEVILIVYKVSHPDHCWQDACSPSLRSLIAGVIFVLIKARGQAHGADDATRAAAVVGGITDGSRSDLVQRAAPAPPAPPAQHSHADQGSAAASPQQRVDASAANAPQSQLGKQDSGLEDEPAVVREIAALEHGFLVVTTRRKTDADMAAEADKIVQARSVWCPAMRTMPRLVVGEYLNKGVTGLGFAALFCGVPVVVKMTTHDKTGDFFAERDMYAALERLQGRAIAKLFASYVDDNDMMGHVVERGVVRGSVRPDDKKLALGALEAIHACDAVHGDAHMGNLAFVDTPSGRRAFWFDLAKARLLTGDAESNKNAKHKDIARFNACWTAMYEQTRA
ncbi:hypothetical protein HK105_207913 [Polyrhizophydium stewartii]|uniref:Protein kinase domain-containing protein n=1 Tax=Polyrhizophydium stewartii TaxID=2732419 RepID=A0ABR4MZB4_9FUNG